MARLTEKEWEVESGLVRAEFYAELRNDIVSEVWVILNLDGTNVTWSLAHMHGMIPVFCLYRLTDDWARLLTLVGPELAEKLESSMKSFLNSNLTHSN